MAMNDSVISNKKNLIAIFKGALISLLISIIGILVFALFLKFVDISDGWIMPINQIIKVISIFFGVKVMLKSYNGAGFIKGLILGIIYNFLAFIVFSILSSSFTIDFTIIYDTLFSGVIGAICGVICVNAKK